MSICALCGGCSLHPSLFPLHSVALLPDLPDVFLRVPREVQVQRPARLPLGGPWPVLTTRHPSQILAPQLLFQGSGACPGGTTRKPWLRCKPRCCSIFGVTPLSLDSGGARELTGRELWREREGTALFPQTFFHRSLQRGPPSALFHFLLRARDMWYPSSVLLVPVLPCCGLPLSAWPCHLGVLAPMWCRKQVEPRATTTIHLRRVENVDPFEIHVADERVGPHTRTCFSAHLCRGLLQWEPSLPQDPCHTARCTMMAKGVQKAATSASA